MILDCIVWYCTILHDILCYEIIFNTIWIRIDISFYPLVIQRNHRKSSFIGKPSISIRAIYTTFSMAMLVITKW